MPVALHLGGHASAEILTSWLALRVYAIAAGVFMLTVCYWIAKSQYAVIPKLKFYGRKPTRKKSIERRLRAVEAYRTGARAIFARSAILVFLFGFVVPGVMLSIGLRFYPWFIPGHEALAAFDGGRLSPVHPAPSDLAAFVISQFAMGMAEFADGVLPGKFEGQLGYLPGSDIVALAIAGFRYFVALFAASFASLFWNAVRAFNSEQLDKIHDELNAALARAEEMTAWD